MAESLTRGMRVIVSGRLRQRSYETKEGEKRTVYEVEVDDVGPSLRNASAKVNRATRNGSGGGQGGGRPSGGQSGGSGAPAAGTPTRGRPTAAAATPTSPRSEPGRAMAGR